MPRKADRAFSPILTSFRDVKILLDKIRHQAKQGNEPAENGQADIEVGELEGDRPDITGHIGLLERMARIG
jgi:hypothetical protein